MNAPPCRRRHARPTLKPIRLFSSDLDGTLLGNPEATQRFKTAWEKLPARRRPLLVFNSGRLVDDLRRVSADGGLPAPDYYIGGVGTQIHDARTDRFLEDFALFLAENWDLAKLEAVAGAFPGVRRQPDEFQHQFKSSWFLERATPEQLAELRQRLAAAGLNVAIVYSSQRDLDLLPPRATKAGALQWLCTKLRLGLDQVLVAGDTGNDASMFRLPGVRGIIVENAQPELFAATVDIPVYTARAVLADGVLDGLLHYGVISQLPSACRAASPPSAWPPASACCSPARGSDR